MQLITSSFRRSRTGGPEDDPATLDTTHHKQEDIDLGTPDAQEEPAPRRRAVHFQDDSNVYNVDQRDESDMSHHDYKALWYSSDELTRFRRQQRKAITALRRAESHDIRNPTSWTKLQRGLYRRCCRGDVNIVNDYGNDEIVTTAPHDYYNPDAVGLERHVPRDVVEDGRDRRRMVVSLVLEWQQERGQQRDNVGGDDECLRQRLCRISQASRLYAQQIALVAAEAGHA